MTKPLVPMALSLCVCLPGLAGAAEDSLSDYQSCLLEYFESAEADVPVGVIREQCHRAVAPVAEETLSTPATEPVQDPVPPEESLVDNRIDAERATRSNPFVLSPHKQNYVLLASY